MPLTANFVLITEVIKLDKKDGIISRYTLTEKEITEKKDSILMSNIRDIKQKNTAWIKVPTATPATTIPRM
ncbi:hypothetical protein EEL30_25775 [Brevibacillus laterosporus]|uniref:Uncharacterized protein n=1 Tax=Brevibacillus laterosporus TaxID=1465 RepID=A0A518VEH5_BRELA|nr:hypothetical protein EEL30_25775 [Brevibacillus laterosporus]